MRIEIRGVERLSFRERQVVVLRESGYSNLEVARRLKLSAGTVATLFNRAKRKGYQVVIVLEGDPLALFEPEEESAAEVAEEPADDAEAPEDEPAE